MQGEGPDDLRIFELDVLGWTIWVDAAGRHPTTVMRCPEFDAIGEQAAVHLIVDRPEAGERFQLLDVGVNNFHGRRDRCRQGEERRAGGSLLDAHRGEGRGCPS